MLMTTGVCPLGRDRPTNWIEGLNQLFSTCLHGQPLQCLHYMYISGVTLVAGV